MAAKIPIEFDQWTREFYADSSGLGPGPVHVLSRIRGKVWAGTDAGISVLDEGVWKLRTQKDWPTREVRVLAPYKRCVLAGGPDLLLIYRDGKWATLAEPSSIIAWDIDVSGKLWVCSRDGLWTFDGFRWSLAKRAEGAALQLRDFRCLADGTAVAATARGLFFLQGKRLYWYVVQAREEGLLSNDARCVRADRAGHLWVATDMGLSVYSGGNGWCSIRGTEGLPVEDLKCMELAPWGEYWFGSDAGVALLKRGRWKYFASKRWLPSDRVNDILPVAQGEALVATAEGVSRLRARRMTLEQKALYYQANVRKYHTRMGYVTKRALSVPGDLASGRVNISDNDGLWTSLYIAAEAFRYGATSEEDAKANALESLNALMRLEEVTGIPGFPARAIRVEGEPGFGDGHPEWHRTPDGKLEWKGDTSSDEIDGHYFALTTYFDLVGGKGEKQRIASYAARLTDHIIEHGYFLVDHDGLPTTWGVWSPKKLNQDDRWRAQRGLNSLEMLSYLRSAHHLTGRKKYLECYKELVEQEHYALNTVKQRQTVHGHQVWHDDRLAYLAYFPLLLYEDDPDTRQVYLLSLERTWRQLRGQRNSLWNIMTSVMTGEPHDLEAAINTLAEYPLDLIEWTVRNSNRSDIVRDPHHPGQSLEPLPADERPITEWAANLHALDGGRDGRSALDGTWYLLPYWMARYYGLLG